MTTTRKATHLRVIPRVEKGAKQVEKQVRDILDDVLSLVTRGVFFALGASALILQETETFVRKAVKKGETTDLPSFNRLKSFLERSTAPGELGLEARIEGGVRRVMSALDIPLKSDVDRLSRRVSELNRRIAKLAK